MALFLINKPYLGDGGAKQTLAFNFSVGDPRAALVPKMVQITRFTDGVGTPSVTYKSWGTVDESKISLVSAVRSDGISELLVGGFSVKTFVNGNNEEHIANGYFDDSDIAGNDKEFEVGEYDGDGTGTRNIEVGFQPDAAVHVQDRVLRVGQWWFNSKGGDNSCQSWGSNSGTFATGFVEGTHSGGFTVGTSLNTSGRTYYWWVFRKAQNRIAQGSYTGTGAALTITEGGIGPYLGAGGDTPYRHLTIKHEAAPNALQATRMDRETSGDPSNLTYLDSNSSVTDAILNIELDNQFTLSTNVNVNTNAETHHYLYLQGDPGFIPAGGPILDTGGFFYSGTPFTTSPYHVYKQNKFLSEEFRRFRLGSG